MARFELIEENNDVLINQVEEMFVGHNKKWASNCGHIIMELDQETAQRVDNCANSMDWYSQLDEEDWKDPRNEIIAEFLNKRPRRYRAAARARRKVEQTISPAQEVGGEAEAN